MTNTVKNLIYFFKRLLPFVLFQFLAEFLTSGYLFATTYTKVDLSFWPLFLMILVFIGTTIASTLFLLIPYVLYLIFIPSKKLGTRLDKWISLIFFFLFSFGVLFEEMAEYFFWEEFESAFNFIAVDYLVYTNEVIGNIYQSYPVVPLLTIMFLITLLFTYLFRRMIALKPEQPVKIKHRFVKAFVYAVFVCCAYGAVEMSDTDVTNKEELNVENHHIPAFIYAPKIFQPAQHHMVMSQMDILPTLLGLVHFNYESRFFGQDVLKPDYVSRYFVSNYQRIGFIRDGKEVVLKPVKQISVDGHEPTSADEPNIKEAIAYYQYATDWEQFLKE